MTEHEDEDYVGWCGLVVPGVSCETFVIIDTDMANEVAEGLVEGLTKRNKGKPIGDLLAVVVAEYAAKPERAKDLGINLTLQAALLAMRVVTDIPCFVVVANNTKGAWTAKVEPLDVDTVEGAMRLFSKRPDVVAIGKNPKP